jgi:hypothetical protein
VLWWRYHSVRHETSAERWPVRNRSRNNSVMKALFLHG